MGSRGERDLQGEARKEWPPSRCIPLNQLHPNFEAEFSRTRYTLRVPAHSERSVPTRRRKEWSALDVQSVPPGTMQQRASRRTSSHARDCTESALPPTVVGGQQS